MAKALDFYAKQLAKVANSFFYPLKPAHYLELVSPLLNYTHIQARVEEVIRETPDAVTIFLRPGKGWEKHQAGQYVRLGISIDGKHHFRTYSISSAPERVDGLISVTVKAVTEGRVSHYLNHKICAGSYVFISLPEGTFIKPDPVSKKILFLTAGSGITPIMSMLRSMSARGRSPDIVHIHYAKSAGEVIFADELLGLSKSLPHYNMKIVYTRDQYGSPIKSSKISAQNIEDLCADWRTRQTYACGPSTMLDSAETIWQEHGLSDNLLMERFQAKTVSLPQNTQGGQVRFAVSQCVAPADGNTPILKVAEAVGLNPAHGCRMGICHGCDASLKKGQVRDLRTGDLITCQDNIKVQICVSAVAGDVELDI